MSIFLRRWPDALWPSENSIESHMVIYCSAIKLKILIKCSFSQGTSSGTQCLSQAATPNTVNSRERVLMTVPSFSTQLSADSVSEHVQYVLLLVGPTPHLQFSAGRQGGGGTLLSPRCKLVAYKKLHLSKIFNFIALQ